MSGSAMNAAEQPMTSNLDGPGGQARRAASGDEPEQGAHLDRAPRPVSTTRVAQHTRTPSSRGSVRSEKDRVYGELERVQRKCAALKREVNELRTATTARAAATVRLEAGEYKKALSYLAYRLENGGVDEDVLRSTVSAALLLNGLKANQRRRVDRANQDAPVHIGLMLDGRVDRIEGAGYDDCMRVLRSALPALQRAVSKWETEPTITERTTA